MYIPKKYGQSKITACPFCSSQAFTKNKQGLDVCKDHKNSTLPDVRCVCGEYLDLKIGKFGGYFFCMNCGNMNLNKGLELLNGNSLYKVQGQKRVEEKKNVIEKPKQQKAKVNHVEKEDRFILDSGKYNNFDYGIQ